MASFRSKRGKRGKRISYPIKTSKIRTTGGSKYNISVDGTWVGHWIDVDPKYPRLGRFYAVKNYPTLASAIKAAKTMSGKIKIYESWGSGPEQRRVVAERGLAPLHELDQALRRAKRVSRRN